MRQSVRAVRRRLGRNIYYFRRLRGLSQERLAELVGNTNKHIQLIERGRANVTLDILTEMAVKLSVNIVELLGRPPRPNVFRITRRQADQIEEALRVVHQIKRANR